MFDEEDIMNWTNARYFREAEIEMERRRRDPRPWYADSIPCGLCGEPCDEAELVKDDESGLMIGTTCSCNLPVEPMCPGYAAALMSADTVSQISAAARKHKEECVVCSGKRKQPKSETRTGAKEEAA